MAKMCVHHHAQALELLQISVDGRDVDVGGSRLDLGGKILGGVVSRRLEQKVEQETASSGNPASPGANPVKYILDRAICCLVILGAALGDPNRPLVGGHTASIRAQICVPTAKPPRSTGYS